MVERKSRRNCSTTDLLISLLIITLFFNVLFLIVAIKKLEFTDDSSSQSNKEMGFVQHFKEQINKSFAQFRDWKKDTRVMLNHHENQPIQKPMVEKVTEKEDKETTTKTTTTKTTTTATTTMKTTTTTTTNENLPDLKLDKIKIEVYSSKHYVYVKVDDKIIYAKNSTDDEGRGIHVVVLNGMTASVMATRVYDFYSSQKEDEELIRFMRKIHPDRILIFAVKDEGSTNLRQTARNFIQRYGSRKIRRIQFRDMWTFISLRRHMIAEKLSQALPGKWGDPITIQGNVQLRPQIIKCNWGDREQGERRKQLCEKYEGYGSVCDCDNPGPIDFFPPGLPNNIVEHLPISVIAGNRPSYLFRMLHGLLNTPGVDIGKVTVYIDGFFDEVVAVTKLFDVHAVQHTPVCSKNCRISQHYLKSLRETFEKHPKANFMIILEEDLDVSKDIMDYFSQLIPLLETDPSLYCISAWNDQGFKHSSNDPSMLYRIETMPGLGWVLKKKLFKEELEMKWPTADKYWDWDMWMRLPSNRKGRECIIPDVSRTFHFGSKGLNVNPFFQEMYFHSHALNNVTNIKFNTSIITKDGYENYIDYMISQAEVLDHTKTPCSDKVNFIPNTTGHTYVLYIKQNYTGEYDTWNNVARCFKLWDLDVRGFHKQMWRFWIKKNHIIVIGTSSPYIKYKPKDIKPIFMLDLNRLEREEENRRKRLQKKKNQNETNKHDQTNKISK